MKSYGIRVPGSVVTKKTAPGYLKRMCIRFMRDRDLTMEASRFLSDIETRIVNAGFIGWNEIEQIEIKAISEPA